MKIQRVGAGVAAFLLISAYCINAQFILPQTPLKAEVDGNIIIAKLVDGDSLFPKILQISQAYGITSGIILSNMGQLREFSIGQFNPESKRYVNLRQSLPWELLSMQGTIGKGQSEVGGLQVNCQATLADSSNRAIGGHLYSGIVSVMNQLVIIKLKEVSLVRKYNVRIGYWELDVLP